VCKTALTLPGMYNRLSNR